MTPDPREAAARTACAILRAVFRLGVIEVRPGRVDYWNRTARGGTTLTNHQEARWRLWMLTQRYAPVVSSTPLHVD